jgi:DNA-binding NarL/FixJ family response regulator
MRLSPREMEVARLVAEDLTDKEIANLLVISIRTVQKYLERIARKVGAGESEFTRRRAIARWVEAAESEARDAA